MDPNTGRFNAVFEAQRAFEEQDVIDKAFGKATKLLQADGSAVPDNWIIFKVGEEVVIKGHTFKVSWIGDSSLVLEPVPLLEPWP